MSAVSSVPVRAPQWTMSYDGVDITTQVSPMVTSITYSDRLANLSGELEVEFEDRSKLWQGPWYPALGDQLSISIGYRGEGLQPCGAMQVDDLELIGPPDQFRLRCVATFITTAMRTNNSAGYENQSLLGIAGAIAEKYGFALIAAPDLEDLVFARVTQRFETDLAFLKRLANEHGYDFAVRGAQLVFYTLAALELGIPVATIERSATLAFRFRNRSRRIFASSQISYLDPASKQLMSFAQVSASTVATADALKLVRRCENDAQAMLKAGAALHLNNMMLVTASLSIPGSASLAAGVTVLLSGWKAFDGVYLIESAVHRITRARGYVTEVEVRQLAL